MFVHTEHDIDSSLARVISINTENLLLSQPNLCEQTLSLVDTLIQSGSVHVVVAGSVIKEHLRMRWANAHMVIQASLMSQTLHKLSHSLLLSLTLIIFISQVKKGEDVIQTWSQILSLIELSINPTFNALNGTFYNLNGKEETTRR